VASSLAPEFKASYPVTEMAAQQIGAVLAEIVIVPNQNGTY
jgi:hypothetical protein